MKLLALIVVACIAAELLVRLPFAALAQRMLRLLGKVHWTLRASYVSDHWKEKVLLHYAGVTAGLTLRLAGSLIIVAAGVVLAAFAMGSVSGSTMSVLEDLTSAFGIGVATLAALVYLSIRRNLLAA